MGGALRRLLFAGNSLDKAQRLFERFIEATEVEADDPATNSGVEEWPPSS